MFPFILIAAAVGLLALAGKKSSPQQTQTPPISNGAPPAGYGNALFQGAPLGSGAASAFAASDASVIPGVPDDFLNAWTVYNPSRGVYVLRDDRRTDFFAITDAYKGQWHQGSGGLVGMNAVIAQVGGPGEPASSLVSNAIANNLRPFTFILDWYREATNGPAGYLDFVAASPSVAAGLEDDVKKRALFLA